jgi:PAS domain S-box-containing protein
MWHDITDIKKMQDRLEEKTAEQNAILENAIAGIAYLKDRRFIWMNSKMEEMFGLSRHEVSGLTTEVLYPSHESYEQFGNAAYPVLADGQTYYTEQLMKRKNGSVFWCSLSGKAIDPSAISKGSIWILQDITERKEAEDRLRQNEAKYRDLFNFSTDGIFIIDFDGNFIDVNNTAYIRLGYTKNELLSLHISKLDHPAFAGRVHERLAQIRDYGSAVFESAHMRKDGTVMPVEVNSRLLNYEGRQVYFSVIRDITERKAAEARIKSALREKEILLKEVHHRVKNNMQVVASMLHLQSGYIKDRESRVVFEESQRRIESLALIHEKLYRSEDLARIDFREYVVDLAGNLLALNTDKAERIKMEVDIEGVVLDVNSSIPCGLIINELVSNALAHAFPNGRKGRIDIRMRNDNERRTVLSVSDNGTGFPEAMDFRNTASLGMQLVTSLVKQLDGVIEMDRTEGTSFTIEFQA